MPIYTFSCFIQLSTRALNVQIPPFTTKWYSREVFLTKRSYLLPGGASYKLLTQLVGWRIFK